MATAAAPSASSAPMAMGSPGSVPPASVPLTFLFAGGIGLVGFGVAAALVADRVVTPIDTQVVAAVHLGVLAFLTTAVLGAFHQFAPVVGRRALRSVLVARITMATIVITAWLLPAGFALDSDALMITGGILGSIAVTLAAWNLSAPLAGKDGGVPLVGLRLSLGYLVITVAFGVTYALDLHTGWFALYPHRILAHAHLGLLGWLGLTYMAVAEKLWPMFLLAHRPSARSGAWAVGLVALGTAVLATGLLFDIVGLTALGTALVLGGFAAHITSLVGAVRHRRRALELLHAFLFASTAFLVVAAVTGVTAGVTNVSALTRSKLLAAEVAALIAWLGLAVIGHAHKIVPFISYTALRSRGVRTNRDGRPLLFADLLDHRSARASLVFGGIGFGAIYLGLLVAAQTLVVVGGVSLALTGIITTANLASGPWRASRLAKAATTTAATTTAATAQATLEPGRTP